MLEVCPTCTDTSAQMVAPLADRGINDRWVELRPLVDETCFEFIDVSNFGAINVLLQNTPIFANPLLVQFLDSNSLRKRTDSVTFQLS